MSVSVKITGGPALTAALRELGDLKQVRRAAQGALRKVLTPMRDTAKSLAPDDAASGPNKFLRESIKIAVGKKPRGQRGEDQVWMVLGLDLNVDPSSDKPRRGGGTYRDPGVAGVGPIIEFGRDGVAPVPFMRGAWDAHKDAAPQQIADQLGPAIEAAARRLAKKP